MHPLACWSLFISRIKEHDFIKDLAHLEEHETDDPEVVSSNPTGAIFDEIYFVLCIFSSVR